MMRSYAGVRVSVLGRSHEEAKERALDALDLLRGIWNLGINPYIGNRSSAGVRTSNNKLSLGPATPFTILTVERGKTLGP